MEIIMKSIDKFQSAVESPRIRRLGRFFNARNVRGCSTRGRTGEEQGELSWSEA